MCRSARVIVAPIVLFTSSCSETFDPVAARVAYVELDFLDRRDRLWNPVVGLLQRGHIGREQAAALDVAEHELAAQLWDAPVIGEAVGDGGPSSWS